MVSVMKGLDVQKSRFAALSLDHDSESEEDGGVTEWQPAPTRSRGPPKKGQDQGGEECKVLSKSAKKRARKKRNKSVSSDGPNDTGGEVQGEIKVESNLGTQYDEMWRKKNEEAMEKEFQRELKEALVLSTIEAKRYEKLLQEMKAAEENAIGQSRRAAKKGVKLSLQELHRLPSSVHPAPHVSLERLSPKTPDGMEILDDHIFHSLTERLEDNQLAPFMGDVELELQKEFPQERRTDKDKHHSEQIPVEEEMSMLPRIAQLKDDLEKKDKVIEKLTKENSVLKKALTEVKERNQSLCSIMSQGEFSKKAELLKLVKELSVVKDDLTSEVETLSSALEQERSKNKLIRLELTKLQNSHARTKSTS